MLRRMVPYSGTIFPEIVEMSAGFVRVRIKDRPIIRNHLNSIHAVALMNLGEMSSGMAVTSAIPANCRAIITRLEIDYLKKARGTLTSASRFDPQDRDFGANQTFQVEAQIFDAAEDLVAKVKAFWLVGPFKAR